jgi:hypothetical protein
MPRGPQSRTPWLGTASTTTKLSSGKSVCKICNNLSPEGHIASVFDPEAKGPTLSLNVEPGRLFRSKNACRFCAVLGAALDGYRKDWKDMIGRISVDIVKGMPIEISIGSQGAKEDSRLEIYVPESEFRLLLKQFMCFTSLEALEQVRY